MSNSPKAKILLVNDHLPTYSKPFDFLGLEYTSRMEGFDKGEIALVVFTGGCDVTPGLYGRGTHKRTRCDIERDVYENKIYTFARAAGIPMVGICRGAQFLCVMAGGRLVQDISGHHGSHEVTVFVPGSTGKGERIRVSSDHHQMQFPFDLQAVADYFIFAWSPTPLSDHYDFDDKISVSIKDATDELKTEPDVVWYPRSKALGVQYHPEWMHEDSRGFKYFRELVEHLIIPIMENNGHYHRGKKATQAAG